MSYEYAKLHSVFQFCKTQNCILTDN